MDNFLDYFTKYDNKNPSTSLYRGPRIGLVVLGNGFNLQCGLHTAYRDFFEYCESSKNIDLTTSVYSELERLLKYNTTEGASNGKQILDIFIKNPTYSVWDIYFINSKNGNDYKSWNWLDVENTMQYSLIEERYWENVSPYFKQYRNRHFSYDDLNISDYMNIYSVIAAILYSRYILDENSGVSAAPSRSLDMVFYEALLSDLSRFEERFGNYIREQYEKVAPEYKEIAEENIVAIYKKGLEELGIDEKEAVLRVVSFNYIPLIDKKSNHGFFLIYITH